MLLTILKLDFCEKNRFFYFPKLCKFFSEKFSSKYHHSMRNPTLFLRLLINYNNLYNNFRRKFRKREINFLKWLFFSKWRPTKNRCLNTVLLLQNHACQSVKLSVTASFHSFHLTAMLFQSLTYIANTPSQQLVRLAVFLCFTNN